MHCRNCGKEVPVGAEFCMSCGVRPKNGNEFCHNCGVATDAKQEICIKCGARLASASSLGAPGERTKIVAGLLGVLVGGLGIHRFYLGYTVIGIVQIIVTICTLGFGALWGFIEGVLILVGTFSKDKEGNIIR
ncbi:MAG: TM2 domain-containing protein [Syntrophobacterales bacterium]|nr:TM2 domain-containing protein [Syntrophobacterales bacterium]